MSKDRNLEDDIEDAFDEMVLEEMKLEGRMEPMRP